MEMVFFQMGLRNFTKVLNNFFHVPELKQREVIVSSYPDVLPSRHLSRLFVALLGRTTSKTPPTHINNTSVCIFPKF